MSMGHQIKIDAAKKQLIITVDLGNNGGPSKSGKTQIIASSKGNITLDEGVIYGLNVYRKTE